MKALVLHAEITAQGTHPARSLVDSLENTWESRVEGLEVKPLLAPASEKAPTLVGIPVLHTGAVLVLQPLTRRDALEVNALKVDALEVDPLELNALEVAEKVAEAHDALELEVKLAVVVAAGGGGSVVAPHIQIQESDRQQQEKELPADRPTILRCALGKCI